jgi:Flp pilus assembly protein TadD
MAKALIKLNRGPEAIAQLEEALRIGSVTWEAHYLLGEQLAFAGRIPEARREFEQTLRLKPVTAMAHLNLGVALVKEGQLEDARREFEEGTCALSPKTKRPKTPCHNYRVGLDKQVSRELIKIDFIFCLRFVR